MPNETWQTIHQRGQQTLAIWNQHNPSFTVGALTRVGHEGSVAGLPGMAQAVADQQDVLDGNRADRDATLALIKDLATRLPRMLDGVLDPGDPLHRDVEDVRVIEMTGLDSILARGQRTLSLWTKVNAKFAALTPPRPAVMVGSFGVGNLSSALSELPGKTQFVEDSRAVLSDRRSDLRGGTSTVDSGNKRWFAAWEGQYPVGTPEHDALAQIEMPGSTPAPNPLEIAGLAQVDATTVEVSYPLTGGGEHATTLLLQWNLEGETTWPHETQVNQPTQTIAMVEFANALLTFRTVGSNSTGEAFSQPQQIQMAPPPGP